VRIDQSTIVVTGGAGLIGSTTVDLLLNEHTPRSVVIFDNFSRGSRANIEHALRDPRVSVVEGDISDRAAVARVVAGADAVIHMAALRITACAAEPRLAFDVMCGGSFNVVEAAQASGVKKIVAASTASVYGMAEEFPTTEPHHPYGNRTWYGASKLIFCLIHSGDDESCLSMRALRGVRSYANISRMLAKTASDAGVSREKSRNSRRIGSSAFATLG